MANDKDETVAKALIEEEFEKRRVEQNRIRTETLKIRTKEHGKDAEKDTAKSEKYWNLLSKEAERLLESNKGYETWATGMMSLFSANLVLGKALCTMNLTARAINKITDYLATKEIAMMENREVGQKGFLEHAKTFTDKIHLTKKEEVVLPEITYEFRTDDNGVLTTSATKGDTNEPLNQALVKNLDKGLVAWLIAEGCKENAGKFSNQDGAVLTNTVLQDILKGKKNDFEAFMEGRHSLKLDASKSFTL